MGAEIRANPDTYAQDYRQILSFYYPHFDMISIQETPIPEATGYPGTTEPEVVAYGVCTGTSVNFRVGPSTSFGTIGKVGHNEHIDIIGLANSEWYHAVWNGHEGYISIGYVSIVLFPSPAGGVFTLMDGRTTTSANLRSEPRTNSANLITTLPKNTTMTAWMHMGKWYFVTTDNGYSGFISNVVAEFSEPYEYAGVTSILGPTRRIPVSAKPIGDAPQPPQWGRIGAE